mgnify:CR=1 FL=1
MSLVGPIPVRFNGRPAVTITDFDVGVDRPGQVKAGGYGIIGTSQGVETGSGSFKIRPRQENGLEFPIDTLRAPFSMAFPQGPQRFGVLACSMTSMRLTNQQQAGDNEWSVSFIYEQLKQSQ